MNTLRDLFSRRRYLFLGVLLLLISIPITVFLAQKQQELRQRASELPTQIPSQNPSFPFPVSQEILQNQAFSQWSVMVKGRVIDKTDFTFTIAQITETTVDGKLTVNDSDRKFALTLITIPNKTTYESFHIGQGSAANSAFSYNAITKGDIIRGTAKPINIKNSWQLVGDVLTVQNKDQIESIPQESDPRLYATLVSSPALSNLLTNPLVDKIFANIEGRVTNVRQDSFTLQANGQDVTLYVEETQGLTTMIENGDNGVNPKEKNFQKMRVGDIVKGGVSIVVGSDITYGLHKRNPGDILAHFMTITHK